ncbi:2-oxo acid dehydrogenase subunit E2 [Methylocystis sp.]|uniref:2-oxo acid dehydrogenase subunit E2 n=1 Tax=Methylocystis sp. TaxID=1911079 RepID=UPI003DA69E2A
MSTRVQGWRKLAGASWGAPRDPQFTGDIDIDAAELLAYADRVRMETGAHVTVTHLVGRAVAHALGRVPAMNVRLARGREHPRESIDVFFIVSTAGGSELTGIKVTAADQKSVVEIADQLEADVQAVTDGTDADFGRAKKLLTLLPPRVLKAALGISAWLTSDLNLDLPALGMRRQAFGGAMITSVGMWGIAHAYSPLAHYYRVPVLVLVGAVSQQPVAVAGKVLVRPVLPITATFDHRYVDGFQAASFAHAVEEYLAHPASFEPRTERRVPDQRSVVEDAAAAQAEGASKTTATGQAARSTTMGA